MSSSYADALQKVIEDYFEGKQTRISAATGVSQALISRHCSGNLRPDLETLDKICQALEPEPRVRLAIAHLQDETPPSARYYVDIKPTDGGKPMVLNEGIPTTAFERLDRKTQKAITYITEEAVDNEAARDSLQSTAKILGADI